MQFISNLRTRLRKNLLKNNAGQGATEYILLLVVIAALVFSFKGKIKEKFEAATDKLGADMSEVTK